MRAKRPLGGGASMSDAIGAGEAVLVSMQVILANSLVKINIDQ